MVDLPARDYVHAIAKYSEGGLRGWGALGGVNVYCMPLMVQDHSLPEEDCFTAYLLSHDGAGDDFFNGLNPKRIYGQNVVVQQEAFLKLKNDLLEHTSKDNRLELVL